MKTVVVNALSSNSGGGISIRDSLVQMLNANALKARYVVFVAHDANLDAPTNPNLKIVKLPALLSKKVMVPFTYRTVLEHYIRTAKASVVLNLGDVIIKTRAKQIYVLDWPYVLDVHPKVLADMSVRDRTIVSVKFLLHRLYFKEPAVIVAQTPAIRSMLIERYGLSDVRVIGNAPTQSARGKKDNFSVPLPDKIRLLCPSLYYPHKNLEVLLDVAEAIKRRGDAYCIITTVTPQSPSSSRFVASITKRGLQDVLINVGQVKISQMEDLYSQCHGILLPSLLESFSIVYPEAMAQGLPILTSDLWFARAVCDAAAAYFDPTSPPDILRAIDTAMQSPESREYFAELSRQRLRSLPQWDAIYASYIGIIDEMLERCEA